MKETGNFIINENPDRTKWNDFVLRHPYGNIFQTSLMFDVYQLTPNNDAGVIALEDGNENILALIVYVLINEPGIKSFFSKRAIVSGGPIVLENNHGYAKILLNKYHTIINKKNAIYTEISMIFLL